MLANDASLQVAKDGGQLSISLLAQAADPIATVIVLDVKGAAKVQ
jgi:hypothetical protein